MSVIIKTSNQFDFPLRRESFIGGRFCRSKSVDRIDVLSPISGNKLYDISDAGQTEVDLAIKHAAAAQKNWCGCSVLIRSNILRKISQVIRQNRRLLMQLEVNDTGKLTKDAQNEMELAAQYFDYFAACIVTEEGSAAEVHDILSINLSQPLGKIAIILPWNFPLLMFCWKVAPAIAAGNAVIVKPSEYACLSIIKLMELIKDIIPKGLINVLLGSGKLAGNLLSSSGGIDKIFFTGGTETGKIVAAAASSHLIPLSMELGGKSACIVTAEVMNYGDDYFNQLIDNILKFTYSQGQVCGNLSRLLIHRSVSKLILDKVKDRLNQYIIGDPRLKITSMGPLISSSQREYIISQIQQAEASGARITSYEHCFDSANGFYLPPYIVEGDHSMEIFHNELFGPVLCCDTFDTLEEAVELANCTRYGLAASVWSRDIKQVNYLMKHIVAGKIWVNTSHLYYPHTKFGGVKQSGFGNEMHKLALQEYQYIKNIIQNY